MAGIEKYLILRCQQGDKDAFYELIIKYQKLVLNFVFRMLGDYEEAQDIAQETFLRAFNNIDNFRGDFPIISWLYQIANNLCIDKLRARQRRKAAFNLLSDLLVI